MSAEKRVVVGVDGSAGGAAALDWALAEARLRGAFLDVVHVWRLPLYAVGVPSFHPDLDREVAEVLESKARALLDDCIDALETRMGSDLGVELNAELVRGNPAHVLVEKGEGADLLVVGSRGLGGFAGLLLGSVGQQSADHAPCPVVIVPAPGERG